MALSASQVAALATLAAKAVDKSDRPFVDRSGNPNLVARVRRTRKGQTTGYTSSNCSKESKGSNGSDYYVIRRAVTDHGTGLHLYCDCPAQRFQARYGNPCKHIAQLVAVAPQMMALGLTESDKRDIIIYNPAAIEEAVALVAVA